MKPLVIVTQSYPYGTGECFLEEELPILCDAFSKVVLIPMEATGEPRPVPANVKVISQYHFRSNSFVRKKLRALWFLLSSSLTIKGILQRPSTLLHASTLDTLLRYVVGTKVIYHLVKKVVEADPELRNALFYSYWFHVHSTGLSLFKKKKLPSATLISRAHGYDVYDTLPFREFTLSQQQAVFTISENGKLFLSDKNPSYRQKFHTSHLGVDEEKFTTKVSKNGSLSLVTCSYLRRPKRIDLFIDALHVLSAKHPKAKMIWNHLGGGEEQEFLEKYASKKLGNRVAWKFHGHLPREEVYAFYRNQTIDIFVSTSETEGIPVSMMEAQACGIPVIATDVGGVKELVNSDNGILLNSTPSPEEVALAIEELYLHPELLIEKKKRSKCNQQKKFNAALNYSSFAQTLKNF